MAAISIKTKAGPKKDKLCLSEGEVPATNELLDVYKMYSLPKNGKLTKEQKISLIDFAGVPKNKVWEECYMTTPYTVSNNTLDVWDTRVRKKSPYIKFKHHPELHHLRMVAETVMMAEIRALGAQVLVEIAPGSGFERRISQINDWTDKYTNGKWAIPPPATYFVAQANLSPYDQKYLSGKGKKKIKPMVLDLTTVTTLPQKIIRDQSKLPGGYYYLGNVVYYMRRDDWKALWGNDEEKKVSRVLAGFAYTMDPVTPNGEAFGCRWQATPNGKQTMFSMDDGSQWAHPTDWFGRLSNKPHIAWQVLVKDPKTEGELMHTLWYFPKGYITDFRDYDEDPIGYIANSFEVGCGDNAEQVADLFGVEAPQQKPIHIATGTVEPTQVFPTLSLTPKMQKVLNTYPPSPDTFKLSPPSSPASSATILVPISLPSAPPVTPAPSVTVLTPIGLPPELGVPSPPKPPRKKGPSDSTTPVVGTVATCTGGDMWSGAVLCCVHCQDTRQRLEAVENGLSSLRQSINGSVIPIINAHTNALSSSPAPGVNDTSGAPQTLPTQSEVQTPAPSSPANAQSTSWWQTLTNSLPAISVIGSVTDGIKRKAADATAPITNLSTFIHPTATSAEDLMRQLLPEPHDLSLGTQLSNLMPSAMTAEDKDQYVRSFARDKKISYLKAADLAVKIEPAVHLAHSRLRGNTDWSLLRFIVGLAVLSTFVMWAPVILFGIAKHHLVWRCVRDFFEIAWAVAPLFLMAAEYYCLSHNRPWSAAAIAGIYFLTTSQSNPAAWLSYGPEVDFYHAWTTLNNEYGLRNAVDFAKLWPEVFSAYSMSDFYRFSSMAITYRPWAVAIFCVFNPTMWVRIVAENLITHLLGPIPNIILDTIAFQSFSPFAAAVHLFVWTQPWWSISSLLAHVYFNALAYSGLESLAMTYVLLFWATRNWRMAHNTLIVSGGIFLILALAHNHIETESIIKNNITGVLSHDEAPPTNDEALPTSPAPNWFDASEDILTDWCTQPEYRYAPLCSEWWGKILYPVHPADWISTPFAGALLVAWQWKKVAPMVSPIVDYHHPSCKRGLTVAPVCVGGKGTVLRPGAEGEPPKGKCNHTSPGYTLLGPRLSFATIYSFKGCTCNAWQAMCGRMGGVPKRYAADPLQVDDDSDEVSQNMQKMWGRMKTLMRKGSKGAPIFRKKPVMLTRKEWSKRYPAGTAKKMENRWLVSDGTDTYSAFIKAEKSILHPLSNPSLLNPIYWLVSTWGVASNCSELSDPRGISVPHVSKRYGLGPQADYFNKMLMYKFRGVIFYACGSTPEEIARWTAWIMQNHSWGLSVMGDDVFYLHKELVDGVYVWFVESLDISRYDMHIRRCHLQITLSVMYTMGLKMLSVTLQRMSWCRNYLIAGPTHKGFLRVKGTRASGDPDTISSNSFITMLVAWDAKRRGVDMAAAFWAAGFVVTQESDEFWSGKWDFLQKLFYPAKSKEGFKPAPKIGRFLARAFWSRSSYRASKMPGYCRGVALSLQNDFNHVPIARSLVKRILQLTEGCTPVYDQDFKRSLEYGHFAHKKAELSPAVYDFVASRYGLSKSDCDLMEQRIEKMQWDEFIDDDVTRPLFIKLCVDL